MKLHRLLALVFLGLVGQAGALHKTPKMGALEEKKAVAAVAEGAGDTKQSVAAAASVAEVPSLLQVLEADPSLRILPSAVLVLIDGYAEADFAKYLPAIFTTWPIDLLGQFFHPLAGVSLSDRRIALLGNDNSGAKMERRLVFVDNKWQNLKENKGHVLGVWPCGAESPNFSACPLGATPDGQYVIMAARGHSGGADHLSLRTNVSEMQMRQTSNYTYEIGLWNLATNTIKIITHQQLQALQGLEFGGVLTVLSNGLVALQDKKDAGAVVLYDFVNNRLVSRLTGHTAQLCIIKLVNPTTIVTGTADGDMLVWDITDAQKPTYSLNKQVIDKNDRVSLDQDQVDVIPHGHSLQLFQPRSAKCIQIAQCKQKYSTDALASKVLFHLPAGNSVSVHTFDAGAAEQLQNLSLQQLVALEELLKLAYIRQRTSSGPRRPAMVAAEATRIKEL